MATSKNITMKQFNGVDYDTLYPKTIASQIDDVYSKSETSNLFLPKAGGSMGGILDMNGNRIANLPTPTSNSDPATKEYVDGSFSDPLLGAKHIYTISDAFVWHDDFNFDTTNLYQIIVKINNATIRTSSARFSLEIYKEENVNQCRINLFFIDSSSYNKWFTISSTVVYNFTGKEASSPNVINFAAPGGSNVLDSSNFHENTTYHRIRAEIDEIQSGTIDLYAKYYE